MYREENPFEDVKREYVNHYSETGGKVFARDYHEFVTKLMTCIQEAMNTTEAGPMILDEVLCRSILEGWSDERWQKCKVDTLKMLFFLVLDECPWLKHEFAMHLYDELRKAPEPQAEEKGGSD